MSGYASKADVLRVIRATLEHQGQDPAAYNLQGIFRDAFYSRGSRNGYGAHESTVWDQAVAAHRQRPHATDAHAAAKACAWRCGDDAPGHRHFAVLLRARDGRLLGRLTADGMAVNRKVHAVILGRGRAEAVAKQINDKGEFIAKAIQF